MNGTCISKKEEEEEEMILSGQDIFTLVNLSDEIHAFTHLQFIAAIQYLCKTTLHDDAHLLH